MNRSQTPPVNFLLVDDREENLLALEALLRRDGELHVADWGRPQDLLMKLASLPVRLLDGFAPTRDNLEGNLPALLREGYANLAVCRAGWDGVRDAFGSVVETGWLAEGLPVEAD